MRFLISSNITQNCSEEYSNPATTSWNNLGVWPVGCQWEHYCVCMAVHIMQFTTGMLFVYKYCICKTNIMLGSEMRNNWCMVLLFYLSPLQGFFIFVFHILRNEKVRSLLPTSSPSHTGKDNDVISNNITILQYHYIANWMLDVNVNVVNLKWTVRFSKLVKNVIVKAAHWATGKHIYVGTETGKEA